MLSDDSEIKVETEGHMHALTITLVDENSITHNWTMYQNGEQAGITNIQFTRNQ